MQIKTKFTFNVMLVVILLPLIGFVEFERFTREQEDAERQELVTTLARNVYDLNFITSDYLTSPTERSKQQWLMKYDSLISTWAVTQQRVRTNDLQLKVIDKEFKTTTIVFGKLTETDQKFRDISTKARRDLNERLGAQLLISTRSLYGETLKLSSNITAHAERNAFTMRIWEFCLLAFFAILSIGMVLIVANSIFPRLKLLMQAFSEVSRGHLDYRLNDQGTDELSSLANSFNQTVARLAEITVSRARLEDEIEIRRASQQRLEQVEEALSEASDSVFMFYANNIEIFYANRGSEQTLGLKRKKLLGKRMADLFPRFADHVQPSSGEAASQGSWESLELEYAHADGSILAMEASMQFIKGGDGESSDYYILIARDISERVALQQQQRDLQQELEVRVRQRTAELEQTNKELEAFSYSISHDLRAPLRAINGQAGMLEEELRSDISETTRRHIAAIRRNSQQMGQLVDDLLAYSRLSKDAAKFEKIDLEAIFTNCWQEIAKSTDIRNIDFRVEPLPPAFGDKVMLRQVVFNLLDNAIKYTAQREQALIEVGSQCHDGETVYFVRDNGVGFDMRYADKIFKVFHRLHLEEEFDGTGIGLSLAKRIVERHNGRIWAEGEVDRGATFSFTLNQQSKHLPAA